MPPSPNRANSDGQDMRQARMEEQRELKDEASLPDDPDPALDEQDLDENHLSTDEADRVEWDPQAKKTRDPEPRRGNSFCCSYQKCAP
ncbi:MAG TPA: hypothetical protein VHD83_22160 [Puia sp.]|nr:hypothetical protein [Puia sp.]